MFTRLALSVHSGHFQAGRDSMAEEGARNANVPPWRMGSLEEGRGEVTSKVPYITHYRSNGPLESKS